MPSSGGTYFARIVHIQTFETVSLVRSGITYTYVFESVLKLIQPNFRKIRFIHKGKRIFHPKGIRKSVPEYEK